MKSISGLGDSLKRQMMGVVHKTTTHQSSSSREKNPPPSSSEMKKNQEVKKMLENVSLTGNTYVFINTYLRLFIIFKISINTHTSHVIIQHRWSNSHGNDFSKVWRSDIGRSR